MAFLRVDAHVCESCGVQYKGRGGSRRKYCSICQNIRDISMMAKEFSRECEICEREFFPYRTNYRRCYECSDFKAGSTHSYPQPCKSCGKHHRPAPGLEKTCCACVQESAKARLGYFKKLREVLAERNSTTTPEAA
jgi:hypothetical protein